MSIPLIEAKNLKISYETRNGIIDAVLDFSFKAYKGDSVGIVGESGCGKTTVLLALMRYLGKNGRISHGDILFHGKSMLSMSTKELTDIRGNKIAMIYQEPMSALNPCLTIGAQLFEVLQFHFSLGAKEAYERCVEILQDVRLPEPAHLMSCYPHQISGGQQQRIVIAMALLSKPELLLLDEPTTALDVTVEHGIVKLIAELSAKYGSTIVYISHNMGLIRQACEDLIVMYSGQVLEYGKTKDIFARPSHPYTRGLLRCIPSPAHKPSERRLKPIQGQLPPIDKRPQGCLFAPRCDLFQASLCDNPAGIDFRQIGGEGSSQTSYQHASRCARLEDLDATKEDSARKDDAEPSPVQKKNTSQPILDIKNIYKEYTVRNNPLGSLGKGGEKKIKANQNISLQVHEGSVVAIVGESGCGKTTLAKSLLGLENVDSGSMIFAGKNIASLDVNKRDPKLIGSLQMVFQNPNETLNPAHSVGYQIARTVRKLNPELSNKEVQQRAFDLFRMVSLQPATFFHRLPMHLSGGQKQRIGIARAFAGSPSLVIADEPVSALDVSVQSSIIELLRDIQRKNSTSLLIISHDLSLVRYLADYVVVMYLGQIMESGPVEAVFSPPYHPYTQALLSAVPVADSSVTKQSDVVLEGNLPSPFHPPKGCPLSSRCHKKIGDVCVQTPPVLQNIGDDHLISCHIKQEELKQEKPVFITEKVL